ncbi:MAG: hypothetical protein M1401_17510 [Chloroflexi bacterium]|nr:hypothetical protein [Chloroflexota bacterium]
MNALVEQPVTVLLRTAVDVAQSWGSYGWILGLLLIAALTAKELLRAYGWPQTDRRMRALNIAVLPLLLLFSAAVVERLVSVLLASA